MKLYFRDSRGNERELGDVNNEKQALKKINEFCEEKGYKIPYIRIFTENNETTFDVGSHTEFFILRE